MASERVGVSRRAMLTGAAMTGLVVAIGLPSFRSKRTHHPSIVSGSAPSGSQSSPTG